MEVNGPIFTSVISQLNEKRRELARTNAIAILDKVVASYGDNFQKTSVGANGAGVDVSTSTKKAPVGLLYGRIQSGKTTAMITTTALAFDNHFRIAVVLTSNINRLVDQTHTEFSQGIPNAAIIYKDDVKKNSLESEAGTVAESLEYIDDYGVIIVSSKDPRVLAQVIEFLKKVGAEKYPSIILDDEGDQATPDNKTRERSKKGGEIKPSAINGLTASLREVLPHSVFVSVTGTPQSLVLQNLNSNTRPSFIQLLEADPEAYTGANTFFAEADPEQNKYITLIPDDERVSLGEEGASIPEGLQNAVCYFILSATSAGIKSGWQDYKMLCHPSMSTSDHGRVKAMLSGFVHDELAPAIRNPQSAESLPYINLLKKQYLRLAQNAPDLPKFDELMEVASRQLARRKITEINKNTTGSRLNYIQGYNFVIGGNSVGRGLAFTNLLVTHYVRESKTTNMDTMFQHARMFGYRKPILEYVQVFMPRSLYSKFYDIAESDQRLRDFIAERGDEALAALIKTRSGLRPTAANRLDANNTKTLLPATSFFPNKPVYSAAVAPAVLEKVHKKLRTLFPAEYNDKQKKEVGQIISTDEALKLIRLIKSRGSDNVWLDKQVPEILRAISAQTGNKVLLKFRTAKRDDGNHAMLMPTGVLGGRLKLIADKKLPTLWVFDVEPKEGSWDGVHFAYPTLLWPVGMDPWVFNRS